MASQNTGATESVERVYAQALYELVEAQGQIDDIRQELAQLGQLLGQSSQLASVIDSRVLRSESLRGIIERTFKGNVSDLFYRFLQVLNEKGRLSILPGVIRSFDELVEEKQGVVQVEAHVAMALDEAQSQQVAAGIGKVIGRNVVLRQHVDPSLIGGLKIRLGDRLIDGSAATQLRLMKQRMIRQGREKAKASFEAVQATA